MIFLTNSSPTYDDGGKNTLHELKNKVSHLLVMLEDAFIVDNLKFECKKGSKSHNLDGSYKDLKLEEERI